MVPDPELRVLSWNVQGAVPPNGSIERIENQIKFLGEEANLPDLVMLNEVTTVQRGRWRESLAEIGYTEIIDTLEWAAELRESTVPPHQDYNHVNGNLIALHELSNASELTRLSPSIRYGPWENADLKDWDTNVPEKILNAKVTLGGREIELWNIRAVPGSMHGEEKLNILENTYNRIMKGTESPCILAGDFNSPKAELADGTTIPWRHDQEGELAQRWKEAELNILLGLEEKGMADVFRVQHGYGELDILDVSHATRTDDPESVAPAEVKGKRFDHMIASEELNLQDCYYDHAGFHCSDHAPLIADFNA
ncbi:endonuclease/exonuclease/phosphatase family protein [Natranaeroarchaeum aerophilus]|uniref:Endonuclease/exonuclease/phosphatase family protein n=1 Tax=Natranaeroarchaeum aerophilus TaxID=2917711 RepID=A0AAE3FTG9_9EURY|nr:endonuclease/exonuclease/phosphatase family protein [Natranaeroarchaeum aerophilus]MCL9815282.1 endonuclease/exonuclease/phosphatase family protein [Natranaeroarchaeum aerophilus]